MTFEYNNKKYEVVIEKKNNKNTYIRVKEDLKIYVSTSYLTPKIMIKSLIENNRNSIIKMIQKREKDNIKQSENYFLGEKIEIRICDTKKTFFDGQTYMDTKYLDYVIVHELSHFIHFDHSKNFWSLVGENEPNYRQIRKEMRE